MKLKATIIELLQNAPEPSHGHYDDAGKWCIHTSARDAFIINGLLEIYLKEARADMTEQDRQVFEAAYLYAPLMRPKQEKDRELYAALCDEASVKRHDLYVFTAALAHARQQDAALLKRCEAVISDIGLVEPGADHFGFGDHEIRDLLKDIATRKDIPCDD